MEHFIEYLQYLAIFTLVAWAYGLTFWKNVSKEDRKEQNNFLNATAEPVYYLAIFANIILIGAILTAPF